MRFIKTKNQLKMCGSHFSGIILSITKRELIQKLGEPSKEGSIDNKTKLEWVFIPVEDSKNDDSVITIYDYKEKENIENIVDWHVGTKNDSDVSKFLTQFNLHLYSNNI